ncbi:MAG: regulatory protein RecX [Spirochaetales bacterium]|nr:regulatory protein RecX [Spirochaetales bacterium]
MDKEAQGENSSSQNVNFEVTHIERGAYGGAATVGLSDGSSFFMHSEVIREISLQVGTVCSIDEISHIKARSAVFLARDKAVEYLAAREYSSSEIVTKLMKKGYDKECSLEAVSLLEQRGYIDDERFAEMWVLSRLRKHPEGRSALAAGLYKKGISRSIIENTLDDCFTDDIKEEALSRCLEKYLRTRSREPKKVLNHLIRRGFRYADIKRHINGIEEFAEEKNLEITEYE